MPVEQFEYLMDTRARSSTLLVLLPGVGFGGRDFENYGFVAEARASQQAFDVLTIDANSDYFSDQSLTHRLHHDVIMPAKSRGYRDVWLGGISLGGFGSLLYAIDHPGEVSGLVLIAPYLGNRGTLAEIEKQGGLELWDPGVLDAQDERKIWKAIRARTAALAGLPIYLLFGTEDRFEKFHRLLASALEPENITHTKGGHDWPTWQALWKTFLSSTKMASGHGP